MVNAGVPAFLELQDGAGHVPWAQYRSLYLQQADWFLYFGLDLAHAAGQPTSAARGLGAAAEEAGGEPLGQATAEEASEAEAGEEAGAQSRGAQRALAGLLVLDPNMAKRLLCMTTAWLALGATPALAAPIASSGPAPSLPAFQGKPAKAHAIKNPSVAPQNPFMARTRTATSTTTPG